MTLRASAALCTSQILRVRSLVARVPSLRIALMRAGHSDARGRRRFTSLSASALVAGLILMASAPLGAMSPGEAAVLDGLSLTSQLSDRGIVGPGSSPTLTVDVANDSGLDLAATSVSVAAVDTDVTTVGGLERWLSTSTAARGSGLGSGNISALSAGQRTTVSIPLDIARAGWDDSWGARALLVTVDGDSGALARHHTALVYASGIAPTTTALAVVVPVVAPDQPGQTIDATALSTLVSSGGALNTVAGQTRSTFATLAIDPRIPVSLAAGGTAVGRAVEWWQNLVTGQREAFFTAYGDADLAGQIQAGATQLLKSGTRDASGDVEVALASISPEGAASTITRTPSASATAANSSSTPGPASSAPAPVVNGWTPSTVGLAWPLANSVDAPALGALPRDGFTSVMLSSGNVGDGWGSVTSARVAGFPALISNDGVSEALGRAASATTDEQWDGGIADAVVRLSAFATDPTTQHATIATLSRSGDAAAVANLNRTLTALQEIAWVRPQGLSDMAIIPAVDATLAEHSEAPERLQMIAQLLQKNDAVSAFATIAQDPDVVTDPSARSIMAGLAVGLAGSDKWPGRVDETLAGLSQVLNSVRVSTDSDINMIGSSATLPIAVENGLATPVTVVVIADPRNNSVSVGEPVTVKVESRAQAVARFSAEAQVSNGTVLVDTWLTSTSGMPVGVVRALTINVHADWETVGLVIFGLVFVGLVAAGVVRTLKRRQTKGA